MKINRLVVCVTTMIIVNCAWTSSALALQWWSNGKRLSEGIGELKLVENFTRPKAIEFKGGKIEISCGEVEGYSSFVKAPSEGGATELAFFSCKVIGAEKANCSVAFGKIITGKIEFILQGGDELKFKGEGGSYGSMEIEQVAGKPKCEVAEVYKMTGLIIGEINEPGVEAFEKVVVFNPVKSNLTFTKEGGGKEATAISFSGEVKLTPLVEGHTLAAKC